MKTLIIYPASNTHDTAKFHLMDPETGKSRSSHICSDAAYAKGDLWYRDYFIQKILIEEYRDEIEIKFIDETNYNWDEIFKKNQQLAALTKQNEESDDMC